MYIDSYIFSIGRRQGVKGTLSDRFQTVELGNDADYDNITNHFSSIKTSDAYIVENKNDLIENTQALEIIHAMMANKPIILLDVPRFSASVSLFLREVILSRLNKIMVCDITMFDDEDVKIFLSTIIGNPVNYSLTKHESALIKSHRRRLFRDLLPTIV